MNTDYDAIVIGAGHNGLTSAALLARKGQKVLCLEKNDRVGGMAITRELFKGYKHNVGAWVLLVFRDEMIDLLELEKYNLEIIRPESSYCNYGDPKDKYFIGWTDQKKIGKHLFKVHGLRAIIGLSRMDRALKKFKKLADKHLFTEPESFDKVISEIKNSKTRELMKTIYYGSATDVLNQFFPKKGKLNLIKGSFSASAIDGTHGGPNSAETGLSLAYHYTMGDIYDFRTFKGGIGALSDALVSSLTDNGGEIRYRSIVKKLLTEGNKVTGVELKNGEKITAKIVLSSLDAGTTFMKLAAGKSLPKDFTQKVKEIDYRNGYLQIHLTLRELPEYTDYLSFANDNNIRWLMAYIRSPEHLQQCWEEYQRGEVPSDPVSYLVIPSLLDPSLATGRGYTCTIFSHYFPYDIPAGKHNEYRDLMADRIIDQITKRAPNFRDSIMDKIVLTHKYFEKTFGITDGDFTHGLIQPSQWWANRPVQGWSDYRMPLDNLYMCGSSTHPGPGVTCIPGYNAANAALKDLGIKE